MRIYPNNLIIPNPVHGQLYNWQDINSEQVIGIDLDILLLIVQGALNTEATIRGYTQTSRQYLEPNLLSQIHTILPISYEGTFKPQTNLKFTFQRMMSVLNWQSWSFLSRSELIYTFIVILQRMLHWSQQLTPEYLQSCCASPDFFGNNNLTNHQPKIIIF